LGALPAPRPGGVARALAAPRGGAARPPRGTDRGGPAPPTLPAALGAGPARAVARAAGVPAADRRSGPGGRGGAQVGGRSGVVHRAGAGGGGPAGGAVAGVPAAAARARGAAVVGRNPASVGGPAAPGMTRQARRLRRPAGRRGRDSHGVFRIYRHLPRCSTPTVSHLLALGPSCTPFLPKSSDAWRPSRSKPERAAQGLTDFGIPEPFRGANRPLLNRLNAIDG